MWRKFCIANVTLYNNLVSIAVVGTANEKISFANAELLQQFAEANANFLYMNLSSVAV